MRLALLLALLAAPLLAGCASQGGGDETTIDVRMSRYRFDPGTDLAINVTKGSVVVLRLTSEDVTHGFSILEYGINVQVPPGETVVVRFVADEAGDFTIFCTVFCGTGHPAHKGTLHVA